MRIPGLRNAHLTYCLNVHPGSTFEEAQVAVFGNAREVFRRFAALTDAGGPFGVGLWLSAQAAGVAVEEQRLERFAAGLEAEGLYVFTLNGFPYGTFHGARVKEGVYRPDWADRRRYEYSTLLAYILGRLLPDGVNGTISTLPVTFKPWADEARVEAAVQHLAAFALFLNDLRRTGTVEIALALEPEPGCYLERTEDILRFFSLELLPRGCQFLRDHHGIGRKVAEQILRRHIGVCLDTTHSGVMAEEPAEVCRRLARQGIRLAKVQLGAALQVDVGQDGPPADLEAYRDDVYLHQVTAQTDEETLFFVDLPEALEKGGDAAGDWRVHYHVPLSWPGQGAIGTTAEQVDADFLAAAADAGCEHFELEIYTLDVFPGAIESVEAVMAGDLAWLWERFRQLG
ncbi:MAG: metabolite traffic protein EboE [Planctomycetota bacterium]